MIDASIGYIQQAADELAKVGIKIPDGIIEGLENGTLSVDDAMKQIEEIIKNGGQVDLTEEGKEAAKTAIDGFKVGADGAAEASNDLKNSLIDPLKSSKIETRAAGVEAGKGFIGPIYLASSEAEKAGKKAGDAGVKGFDSAQAKASSSGQNLGKAMGKGIPIGFSMVKQSIINSGIGLVTSVMSAMRKAADVNSPSKKARDLVGKPIGQGVGVGIESEASTVAKRAANATNSIIEKMRSQTVIAAERLNAPSQPRGFDMSLSDLKNALSGGRNITVNYENTFNSAAARDGEALLRQLDRALGAKI